MFGFFFKKNFCDIWDNMIYFMVVNVVTLAAVAGSVFGIVKINSLDLDQFSPLAINLIQLGSLYAGCFVSSVFILAEGKNCQSVADFGTHSIPRYFAEIPKSIKDSLLYGLVLLFVCLLARSVILAWNMSMPDANGNSGSIVSLVMCVVIFWFTLTFIVALQWVLAFRNNMGNGIFKCLRKSFTVLFDNPGISILIFLNNLLMVVITVVTFGLVPGFAGLQLSNTEALRLLIYKYDWIEVNPGLSKKQLKRVPWKDLLAKDKRALGPRKFKSFIFPWKE